MLYANGKIVNLSIY